MAVPQEQDVVVEEEQGRDTVAAEQQQCCRSKGAAVQRLLAVRLRRTASRPRVREVKG